jgi:copper chaperone CopZ
MRWLMLLSCAVILRGEFLKIEQSFGGMECSSCADFVQKRLQKNPDIQSVQIDQKKGVVRIDLKRGNRVRIHQILGSIQQSGYTLKETRVVVRGMARMNRGVSSIEVSDQVEIRVKDPDTMLREYINKTVEVEATFLKVESEGRMIDILRISKAKLAPVAKACALPRSGSLSV